MSERFLTEIWGVERDYKRVWVPEEEWKKRQLKVKTPSC